MTTERYYAVDAEGTKWTLKADNLPDAQAEIAQTYFLRKIATHIARVTEETLPNA
ncbi:MULTISPECIES: hypothetical protein [unclassified Mesorhizobium]|uniref:hypothetical protein n=1 Tax=unclassified Mesorhizobium TaxID=325217 RepID=UPI0013DF2B39|nr:MULTISPECIES: hypothetical protein [unclassified Mesorhizobium]